MSPEGRNAARAAYEVKGKAHRAGKADMKMRVESYITTFHRFALNPIDDDADQWLTVNLVNDTKRDGNLWILNLDDYLETILRMFMRDGGTIG